MSLKAKHVCAWFMWPKVAWLIAFAVWAVVLGYVAHWIDHREPPFEMSMYDFQVPEGSPGEVITFKTAVVRDLNRHCSATYNKELLTANGSVQKIDDGELSASAIAMRESLSPGMLSENFPIPLSLPPGKTLLITDSRYRCLNNPSTWFFPIDVTTARPFIVLPPKQVDSIIIQSRKPE